MTPQRRRGGATATAGHQGWALIVEVWAASRAFLLLIALIICLQFGKQLVEVVSNWDVQHFLEIANHGYAKPNEAAFFPGLPFLLHVFGLTGLPLPVAGLLISLVCSLIAAVALWRLGGARTGPWAAAAWLIAPTAVFTFVPYTESLFCALAFWAWERAGAHKYLQMALLAALACTVRVSGLFLVGALFIVILTNRRSLRANLDALATLLIPLAVLGGYVVYHWRRTGDWMAWYHAQTSGWSRGFQWPWVSFQNTLPPAIGYPDHPDWTWVFRGELAAMAVGLLITIICLLRRRWAEAAWVGVQVIAFTMSYWWMSVNRAVLLWFPLFLLIGELGCWKPRNPTAALVWRAVVVAGVALSLFVAGAWAVQFYLGLWSS